MMRLLLVLLSMLLCFISNNSNASDSGFMYINLTGDVIINANTFLGQINETTNGATSTDPALFFTKSGTFVYDSQSGATLGASVGFVISETFMFEAEYRYGLIKYWEEDKTGYNKMPPEALHTALFNSPYYLLSNTMNIITMNAMAYYDNDHDTIFFGGLGAGVNNVRNAFDSYTNKDGAFEYSPNTTIKKLFDVKATTYLMQGIIGIQFQMTDEVGIAFRLALCYSPVYGISQIKPVKTTSTTTGGSANSSTQAFVAYAPISYDFYGIKHSFSTAGIMLKVRF